MLAVNREFRLPNPDTYPRFRAAVWWLASQRIIVDVYGVEHIPAPPGQVRGFDYYPDSYDCLAQDSVDSHAFVIAPRHHSIYDIVLVGAFLRPFALVGKPWFAMMPGLKERFEDYGLYPVFRPGTDDRGWGWRVRWRRRVSLTGEEMIDRVTHAAKMGIPVEIYPEGTREGGGDGRFGVFKIAMNAGVSLLPAGIYYGKRRGLRLRRQATMVIGAPMELPDCSFAELDRDQKVAMADAWKQATGRLREQAEQLQR